MKHYEINNLVLYTKDYSIVRTRNLSQVLQSNEKTCFLFFDHMQEQSETVWFGEFWNTTLLGRVFRKAM